SSGLVISSYSQSDFREGFIIALKNDTIHGLVNFREGSKSYRFCDFKTSEETQVYTYSPDQLIGYGFVNDKFFVVKEVIVGGSGETEFVQLLVGGLVNLYKFEALYFVSKA